MIADEVLVLRISRTRRTKDGSRHAPHQLPYDDRSGCREVGSSGAWGWCVWWSIVGVISIGASYSPHEKIRDDKFWWLVERAETLRQLVRDVCEARLRKDQK